MTALTNKPDSPKWIWDKSGKFTVRSLYSHLCSHEYGLPYNVIWKAKIPLKIKIFMWLVYQGAILTKDNLTKRKWQVGTKCAFCNDEETIHHLFSGCTLAKYVWILIGSVIGANCRPESSDQYFTWIKFYLPDGKTFYMVGLATICCALWKLSYRVCF